MPPSSPARRVLVIEPEAAAAEQLSAALAQVGAEAVVAADAESGWRAFARDRCAVILTALHTPREDAAWLLRRLHTEYMGTLPGTYVLSHAEQIGPELRMLELDGVIVPPVSLDALAAIVGAPRPPEDTAARETSRLRELYELTILGADAAAAADTFLARVATAFGVRDCAMWGTTDEELRPRTSRAPTSPEGEALLRWRCDLALAAGSPLMIASIPATVLSAVTEAPAQTLLAAAIALPAGPDVGGLCLIDDGARRFTPDERDALRLLARRLALETSWLAAHGRLIAEHERLRANALLDPMLGVWTRPALEQSLQGEIAAAVRRDEPLAVAVVDVDQLRQINDRYGHLAGDAALVHLTRIARAHLRAQDVIGRFGGDELALVIPGATLAEARVVVEGLVAAVAATPLQHRSIGVEMRIGAGVTAVAPDETSGEGAFSRALAALRRARRTRNAIVLSDPGVRISSSDVDELGELDGDVLPAGSTLGGMYRIRHEIARGAMGVVYRGEDLGLGRPVAIKVLRSDLAVDDALVARFREEAAMLASVQHPHLVQVYAFGAQGEDVYFVMELVEGEPLSDLLRGTDELAEGVGLALVAKVVDEIAAALTALHQVGAIHRDVKPANVLVDRIRDRAVLVDVGVAKKREARSEAAGTPGFAAPESFLDAEETPATDVYGLAATTYMMLTGLAPFGSGDVDRVLKRQLYDRPAAPAQLRPGLPLSVDAVVLRGLAAQPEARFSTADAFAAALREALSSVTEGMASDTSGRIHLVHPAAEAPMSTTSLPFTTRRLEAPPPGPESGEAAAAHGHTRGALFRVAYRLLGNRLGSSWVRRIVDSHPELASVLNPTVPPLSWQPVDHLVTLLRASAAAVQEPTALAGSIGRAAMTSTFARFFGADPRTLTPMAVLKAAESYWPRYHTWGKAVVEAATPVGCMIAVAPTPGEPLVCALVEGSLGRIAELAGAHDVSTGHPECLTTGGTTCRFLVQWGEAVPLGT